MIHPLINKDSKHYRINGKESIEIIEEELTVTEMIGACSFNIMKYDMRKDNKGQRESDLKKISTYEAYRDLLEGLRAKYRCGDMVVAEAYMFCRQEITY